MAKKCIKYGKNTYKPNILFDKIRNNPEFFAKKHGITGADVEKVLGIGKSGSGIDFNFAGMGAAYAPMLQDVRLKDKALIFDELPNVDFQIPNNEPQKPKNLMPNSLLGKISDELRKGGGSDALMNVVKDSSWYKGLGKSTQENLDFNGVKSLLADSYKYYKEQDKLKSNAKTEKKVQNAKEKTASKFKEKIMGIKASYEEKIRLLNRDKRDQKIVEKAKNDLINETIATARAFLKENSIEGYILPSEITSLVAKLDATRTGKDKNKSLNNFFDRVESLVEKVSQRTAKKESELQGIKDNAQSKIAEIKVAAKEKLTATKTDAKEKLSTAREKIISVKEVIAQTIEDAKEKGLFKTTTSGKTLAYAMQKLNKAVTATQQKNVLNTIKKIINDNDYLIKLNTARSGQKAIAKVIKNKTFSKAKVNITTARAFLKLNPNNVSDIDVYNAIAKAIHGNLKGVTVNTKLEVANKNYNISHEGIQKYIDDQYAHAEKVKADQIKAEYDELNEKGLLPVDGMTLAEYTEFTALKEVEDRQAKMEEKETPKTMEERTKLLSAIVSRKVRNDFAEHISENKELFTDLEKEIASDISNIDVSKLNYKELVKLNDVINNIITNNSFMDAGNIANIAKTQQDVIELDKFKEKSGFNFLSLSDNWFAKALQHAISNDMLVEFMTNSTIASAKFKQLSGISAVMDGHARAKITQQNAVNRFIKIKRKYGSKVDNTENRYIRGVYAEILRTQGGTEEEIAAEFNRKKGLVKQTYTALLASKKENDIREGQAVEKAYNTLLEGSENIADVENKLLKTKDGKFNKDSVKYWIDEHAKYKERFIEQGSIFNNKELSAEENYTGRKYRPITERAELDTAYDLFESIFRSPNVNDKSSASKNETVRNINLPKGMVLDLNFDKVQAKMLYDNLYDVETAQGIARLKTFLTNPENKDRIGGDRNMEALQAVMKNTVLAQKNSMPFENDPLSKAIDRVAGSVMMKSARMALGSVTQLPKQYLSVWVNTSINLGKDIGLMFEAYKAGGKWNNIELFNQFNIGLRGSTIAGYNKENITLSDENSGTRDKLNTVLYDVNKASKYLYDGTMKALEFSDVQIARTSWLAFYMKYLKNNTDRNIPSIDWQNEHKNPNQDAAAYAEQMVSRLQNANDSSSMADAFKDTNTAKRVLKNMALPYSTFAVNQRARMTGDLQKIIHGSIDGREDALKSLSATIVEQAVFNGMKLYVLKNAAIYLGSTFLRGVMGWEDEDVEELYASGKKYTNKTFITNTLSDVFFSGMGGFTQSRMQVLTNKVAKLITGNKDDIFYQYKNDPDKTGIPDWVGFVGAYGTSMQTAFGIFNDAKYLDGKGMEVVGGGTEKNAVIQEKELSADAKRLIYFTFIIDALALAGLSDQYILQVNQQIKKGRDRAIKNDLGDYYTSKMYTPSTSDDYDRIARDLLSKKLSPYKLDAEVKKLGLDAKDGDKVGGKIENALLKRERKQNQERIEKLVDELSTLRVQNKIQPAQVTERFIKLGLSQKLTVEAILEYNKAVEQKKK